MSYKLGIEAIKFLKALRNLVKNKDIKTPQQAYNFAKLQFGKITDDIKKGIDDIFEKSPLAKVLDRRKIGKQSIDERKVLDMEGKVIDPNQPILGGKQTKMETPSLEFNVEKFIEDFPVSREEAIRISQLPRAERKIILQRYIDDDFKQQIEIMKFNPNDRKPNAYGGIAGTLRLNRTGYGIGSAPKAFKLAKEIRQSKKYKDFIEALFIKASNMIRQGKGMWKGLDQKQMIKQHDNLTNEVTNFQKTGELPEDAHQYFGMNPEVAYAETLQKASVGPGEIKKGVADVMKDTSDAGLARSIEIDNLKLEFPGITDEMIENILTDTNPQRIAEVKATMNEAFKMQEKGMGPDEIIEIFEKTPRTKNAEGGRVKMAKGGLPNILGY